MGLKALQEELQRKNKKLELIMAIDHIRDSIPDPVAMLTAIVKRLADHFETDFCLLTLINRETGELELKVVNIGNQEVSEVAFLRRHEWAERTMALDHVTVWQEEDASATATGGKWSPELQLALVPIIMGENDRLGALLLGRSYRPFTLHEVQLLEVVEDHVDSAVIQAYTSLELQQRITELELIYRIDRIRDNYLHLDEMLNAVLQELLSAIHVEMAFIMLYNHKGQRLEMRAATHDDLFVMSPYYQMLIEMANQSLRVNKLIYRQNLTQTIHSAMCLPLILNEKIIGVLGVINRYGSSDFTVVEKRLLKAIGSQLDTAIFESLQKGHLHKVLGRSVGPRIMKKLLAHPDVEFLKGELRVLTVLYCDLRGSTCLAEETEAQVLVEFINDYLGEMTKVILAHEGTLDKFVGDQVMALFGAPFWQANHALRAVEVALAMQAAHQTIIAKWKERGMRESPIGIGIATGELTVGEMGSPLRSDYTVIGRAANLGARICSVAKGGQILISQATYDQVREQIEAKAIDGWRFKGVASEVTVYEVKKILH